MLREQMATGKIQPATNGEYDAAPSRYRGTSRLMYTDAMNASVTSVSPTVNTGLRSGVRLSRGSSICS